MTRPILPRTLVWFVVTFACRFELEPCPELTEDTLEEAPPSLAQTGLYTDIVNKVIATEARSFAPQFPLWSDGADKHRWIILPPGSSIDTSTMDEWQFPIDTKLFKEFVRDGKRIETRMLHKIAGSAGSNAAPSPCGGAPGTWRAMTYVWNDDETDAEATFYGVDDARDTAQDVPAVKDCIACHGGARDFVLGFSAIQLAHDDTDLSIDTLVAAGTLSNPVPMDELIVPGDDPTRSAIGYLHGNCGHCHNAYRNDDASEICLSPEYTSLQLKLYVDDLVSVGDTAVWRTAVGERGHRFDGASRLIEPGDASKSLISRRMRRRDDEQMPPLATESVDVDGLQVVNDWIESL